MTTPESSDARIKAAGAGAPQVEFASEVLQQIRLHARSSMEAEICGVLVGEAVDGVTRVVARIAGEGADQGGAHVTFTQDTWEHIFKIKDKEFPGLAIVGWYHSHPGFGIFLSDYDLFIHGNFFNAPHQVAWVFDPHSDDEGCFGWVGGEVGPLEEIRVLRKPGESLTEPAMEGGPMKPETGGEAATGSLGKVEKSALVLEFVAVAILAFGIGYIARPWAEDWMMGKTQSAPAKLTYPGQ